MRMRIREGTHSASPDQGCTDSALLPTVSVAEAYLALLKDRGIDYLYVGAGTDTAPIIEAYACEEQAGLKFPKPIVAVHENLAVGMAHGYYMVSGKPQAVMLHVTVGAANAVCALMNAARSQVPVFFTAGRTPLYEEGRLGSRNSPIHWAQEMFDQAGMARELVKWDYELRDGLNLEQIVDRALSVSMAEPRGPVYLTLPREVLAQPLEHFAPGRRQPVAASAYPDLDHVDHLARILASAEYPLLITSAVGANVETVSELASLSFDFGIGVAESMAHYVNVPSTHALHLGHDTSVPLVKADVVLVLESDVPWIPARGGPRVDAFVAHVGVEPLFSRLPVRSFRSDLTLTSKAGPFLAALREALDRHGANERAEARRERLRADSAEWRKSTEAQQVIDAETGGAITKLFLSRCLDEVRPADSIVVNEYSLRFEHMNFTEPGTYFLNSTAGGLGWGFPAALGAQQAAARKMVIVVQGDGAYMFSNPTACHQAARMHDLPVLVLVYNNSHYLAVENATLAVYPDGATREYVRRHGKGPLSALDPTPDFEMYAQASGGYGERVTQREQLVPALRRAMYAVQTEGRHALLNVVGV